MIEFKWKRNLDRNDYEYSIRLFELQMKFLHILLILGEQTLNKKRYKCISFYLYSCLTELPVIRNTMIKQSVLTVLSCYHTFVLVAEFR